MPGPVCVPVPIIQYLNYETLMYRHFDEDAPMLRNAKICIESIGTGIGTIANTKIKRQKTAKKRIFRSVCYPTVIKYR